VVADRSWITPHGTQLAQIIYEERAFGRLPELSLILEQAGCDNRDLLEHCGNDETHVRGCWVLDMILNQ